MTEVISHERWKSAQMGEMHHFNYDDFENYRYSSSVILRDHFNIDIENDLSGKKILESGGGCYPSVYFCKNLKKAVNVEPLYSNFPDNIKSNLRNSNIECIDIPFEDYKVRSKFDEVWFFNVLQHVRDPYLQIRNAKRISNVIRVFEPINTEINNEHPHRFTLEFFKEQFLDTDVKLYNGGTVPRFHQADCAYLTWIKK